MKKFRLFIFCSVAVVLLAFVLSLANLVRRSDGDFNACGNSSICFNNTDFVSFLTRGRIVNIARDFPYGDFKDSFCMFDIQSVPTFLNCVDSLFPADLYENQEVMTRAYTSSQSEVIRNSNNLDSILIIFNWCRDLSVLKLIDKSHEFFYDASSTFWYNWCSNSLSNLVKTDPRVKYIYKYRYLATSCQMQQYSPSIRSSNSEKLVLYLIDGNWGHIISKAVYDTSPVTKIFIITVVMMTILSYVYFFISILKFLRKKWERIS